MTLTADPIHAPELSGAVEWLNVRHPLTLKKDLRGKIVLLDFWTYGCINCMHVLPDLKRLEHKYREELVVVGIHSAKFTNERKSANIRRIITRYEIEVCRIRTRGARRSVGRRRRVCAAVGPCARPPLAVRGRRRVEHHQED